MGQFSRLAQIGQKVPKMSQKSIYFHRKSHLFLILAKFDVIFRGEGVEIAKISEEQGKREFQELFKYQISLYVSLLVAQISGVKGTPLFSDF